MRRLVTALAAAAVFVVPATGTATAASTPQQETATSGQVTATLNYVKASDFQAKNLRLTITRAGAPLVSDYDLWTACRACDQSVPMGMASGEKNGSIKVVDLDGDGEPEVLADLYTGGAHCCSITVLFFYDPTTNTYKRLVNNWGDPGYRLANLDKDGKQEFLTDDDRFAYAFCAYVCSARPGMVLRFEGGRLVNVTKSYPLRIKSEASSLAHAIQKARKSKSERFAIRGLIPAFCADEYLLGQGDACNTELYAAQRHGDLKKGPLDIGPSAKNYVKSLKTFLRKTGYIT